MPIQDLDPEAECRRCGHAVGAHTDDGCSAKRQIMAGERPCWCLLSSQQVAAAVAELDALASRPKETPGGDDRG